MIHDIDTYIENGQRVVLTLTGWIIRDRLERTSAAAWHNISAWQITPPDAMADEMSLQKFTEYMRRERHV